MQVIDFTCRSPSMRLSSPAKNAPSNSRLSCLLCRLPLNDVILDASQTVWCWVGDTDEAAVKILRGFTRARSLQS